MSTSKTEVSSSQYHPTDDSSSEEKTSKGVVEGMHTREDVELPAMRRKTRRRRAAPVDVLAALVASSGEGINVVDKEDKKKFVKKKTRKHRGRPRKTLVPLLTASPSDNGVKRGRGRPRKVIPPYTPALAGCEDSVPPCEARPWPPSQVPS